MKKIYLIAFLVVAISSFGQERGDKKIIISLPDSSAAFETAKVALIRNDFIIKDLSLKDTLLTYARELNNITGYAIFQAEISGNKIILSGLYGLKKISSFGYNNLPKSYLPIRYYPASKTWNILLKVAQSMGGSLIFSN